MSQLAARQFQTENKDVNNLWHWPTEYAPDVYIYPTKIFDPSPFIMKWASWSDSGYSVTSNSSCRFTNCSVTACRPWAHQASILLDLKPDQYTMSFNSDIQCRLNFLSYAYIDDINVSLLTGSLRFVTFNSGFNNVEFQVLPNTLTVLQIMGVPFGTWVTLTDIVIR